MEDLLGGKELTVNGRQRQLYGDGVVVEHPIGDRNGALYSAIDLDGGNGRCLKGQLTLSKVSSLRLDLDGNLDFYLIIFSNSCTRLRNNVGLLGSLGHAINVGVSDDIVDCSLVGASDIAAHSRFGLILDNDQCTGGLGTLFHGVGIIAIVGGINIVASRNISAGVGGEQTARDGDGCIRSTALNNCRLCSGKLTAGNVHSRILAADFGNSICGTGERTTGHGKSTKINLSTTTTVVNAVCLSVSVTCSSKGTACDFCNIVILNNRLIIVAERTAIDR